MKALEKDRTRRYETALSLARDVQRYLADDVVEAPAAIELVSNGENCAEQSGSGPHRGVGVRGAGSRPAGLWLAVVAR